MRITYDYNGLLVKANFIDNCNVLFDNSGTGKTFLFDILPSYCQDNGLSYIKYGYDNMFIKGMECPSKDLIILDNADLYLNVELFKKLKDGGNCVLISLKDLNKVLRSEVGLYEINICGNTLEAIKYG